MLDVAGTGDDEYLAGLKAGAGRNVRFRGWISPDAFFPEIDLLVLPSVWPDPQPRVTFEAFSYGVPVIGSRAGGIPEEIDEGETGWLFEAGSAEDLSRLLARRIADRADRAISPGALEARLARLEPSVVIAQYEQAFAEAIERSSA